MIVKWKYKNLYSNEKYLPFRTYFFGQQKLIIHQKTENINSQTGNIVWDGAYILAQYLYHDVPLKDKIVLELGSGHGFLSLVCAKAGASKVIATDLPDQLDLVRKNVLENQATDHVDIRSLEWGEETTLEAVSLSEPPDYIIASEILYLPHLHTKLIQTLIRLGSKKTRILMSYKDRELGENRFFIFARQKGLIIEDISEAIPEDFVGTRHYVFSVKLP